MRKLKLKQTPVKTTVIASALTLGVVAGATVPTLLTGEPAAKAAPVEVATPVAPVDFSGVVQAVKHAVVSVQVKTQIDNPNQNFTFPGFPEFRDLPEDHPFNRFFRRFGESEGDGKKEAPKRPRYAQSQGSGFFISEDGLVVTNYHVVDNGSEFRLVMDDGTELDADLVGSDKRSDLALLRVKDPEQKFQYVRFADEVPPVGSWVLAVGNPFGLGGTVTSGIISAHGRDINARNYESFIQIDAAVNKGNSGGPTFNLKGEVVGVNTAIFSPSGGNVGIAFAIPAGVAKDVVSDLKTGGKVERGWLGVHIQNVSDDIAESLGLDEASGAMVTHTDESAPAYKAGVEVGDVILAVDGNKVQNTRELARAIGRADPNSDVELTLWRDGNEMKLPVNLGVFPEEISDSGQASPAPMQPAKPASVQEFGLELQSAEDGTGIEVVDVTPDGVAAEKGLASGDIILEAGGKSIKSVADFEKQIAEAKNSSRRTLLLQLKRQSNIRFVALPLGKS
ncbi:serine protease Do [Cohaesibacter sp. ES.047]|uniref:Do family serine endopeptidase n=1 Tax=Cohaesibacter sp. ES.047 TaxID=1798205 RepID=UPI000BB69E48|nr:Do family serine endopeptidase [Cohaesibacter sp. ES.047]SNY92824.1 serine protease Do [Cohaesibacter sp. ES.047]